MSTCNYVLHRMNGYIHSILAKFKERNFNFFEF
jgi:hypothetical protein